MSREGSTLERLFYIGPESSVYHTSSSCVPLNRIDRYWPLHEATGEKAEQIKELRSKCQFCVKRDSNAS